MEYKYYVIPAVGHNGLSGSLLAFVPDLSHKTFTAVCLQKEMTWSSRLGLMTQACAVCPGRRDREKRRLASALPHW